MSERPQIVIIGGPNGAGKSTIAGKLVPELLGLAEFVNADAIASGLAAFAPERVAFAAGRVMISRLNELAAMRADFAFETTMASRTFVPWLKGLHESGYQIHAVFVWVRSVSLARTRVRNRAAAGGHSIPPDVIERRYRRGIANFIHEYSMIADHWRVYDNSSKDPHLVASSSRGQVHVSSQAAWKKLQQQATS